jgi:uncharacterized protein (TIGR00730 family)
MWCAFNMGLFVQPQTIGVFCGSRPGNSPLYAEAAHNLGQRLGVLRKRVVFGAGGGGLMGVVARAALASGAEVVGVVPHFLTQLEPPVANLHALHVVNNMAVRKQQMYDMADGFIVLPGGIGTLDELTEIVSLHVLKQQNKPIALLNTQDYWQPWYLALQQAVNHGFADAALLQSVTLANTLDELGL